jgi:predicted Zn-dependent protease
MLNRIMRSIAPDLQRFENPVISELHELGHFCGLSEVLNKLPIAELNP